MSLVGWIWRLIYDLTHRFEGQIKVVNVEPTVVQRRASWFALLVYTAGLSAWTVTSSISLTATAAFTMGLLVVGYFACS